MVTFSMPLQENISSLVEVKYILIRNSRTWVQEVDIAVHPIECKVVGDFIVSESRLQEFLCDSYGQE